MNSILFANANEKILFATNWLAQPEHGGFYQALGDNEYSKCNPLIEKESEDFVTDIKVAHGLFVAHRDNRVSEYISGKAEEGNSYGQMALGYMHLTGTYGAIKDKVKSIR